MINFGSLQSTEWTKSDKRAPSIFLSESNLSSVMNEIMNVRMLSVFSVRLCCSLQERLVVRALSTHMFAFRSIEENLSPSNYILFYGQLSGYDQRTLPTKGALCQVLMYVDRH